jgi:hypothetical protein
MYDELQIMGEEAVPVYSRLCYIVLFPRLEQGTPTIQRRLVRVSEVNLFDGMSQQSAL